ncbi:MAG: phospho-sugar mutase [Clostridiales bacterium]|nr:phospho-sugar mutase [Clostridiales bacterium]
MENYRNLYEQWCTDKVFDDDTRAELESITDEREIKDRFYKQLNFGTGGLRGIMGAGINRMNKYTVGKASQGLAEYINSTVQCGSVVIAYDSRNLSWDFARESALVFCANGIKTYLFSTLHSTPQLSFAVRYLHASAGVVITASHNSSQYNGYKVYQSDGCQIVPPFDKAIMERINNIVDYSKIKRMTEQMAMSSGLLNYIGDEIDDAYISELKKLVINPQAIARCAKDLKIVYTPLNGTGLVPVCRILKELGFANVYVVREQEQPNGNFPTVVYPNPEDKRAFDLALALAREVHADVVLATDPDADRLGVYVFDKVSGEYKALSGNMSGLLIAEYELSQKQAKGLLPHERTNGAIVTTVVSSNMVYDIAKEYGLTVIEVLTGFKYIGDKINQFERAVQDNGNKYDAKKGAYEYLFGLEESYGCLFGTYARDKDGVAAAMAVCEAAAYYKMQGLSLWDQMLRMYEKYGYYLEGAHSIEVAGADGAKKTQRILSYLRKSPITEIGGLSVIAVHDYSVGTCTDMRKNAVGKIDLPKSDVIYYELENNAWCCVRPSGTEPKFKIYFGVKGETMTQAHNLLDRVRFSILEIIQTTEKTV